MQNNDGARPGMNPYMRPMGRSSLLSAPAPLTPVQPAPQQEYTPNEPEEETPVCEEIPAWEAVVLPREEAAAEETPAEILPEPEQEPQALPEDEPVRLFVELPEEEPEAALPEETQEEPAEMMEPQPEEPVQMELPLVVLPLEEPEEEPAQEEPAQDESVERMVELPDQLPQEAEEEEDEEAAAEPADQLNSWPEPVDYAAIYAMSRAAEEESAPEEELPRVELPEEEPADEPEEPAEEPAGQPVPETEQAAYDFDPAYYAAYWQQWQNAMEAHQAATCSACPLLNNHRGKVCYVPVIIPDGTDVDPEAVLTLRNAPAAPAPAEETVAPAVAPEELPPVEDIDDGFDDDDEDFTGEDAMNTEDMPTPQTVPVGGPDLGPDKKKSRKWPWFLLALVALLVGGVFALSRTGHLQAVVDWLKLPEGVVQWLKDITLL